MDDMRPIVVKVRRGDIGRFIATIPLMPQIEVSGLSMAELRKEVPGAIASLFKLLRRPVPLAPLKFEDH